MASGKSNDYSQQSLDHVFLNSAIANVGDGAGLPAAATVGDLYIGLHTATLDATHKQNQSEAAYTNYVRKAVARSGAGWSRTNQTMGNAAAVTFAQSGSGPETETDFSIGKETSGATDILYWGALTAPLVVNSGVTPEFTAADDLTASES